MDSLTDFLVLSEQLLAGRSRMLEPQDLPGRYGKVVRAVDRLLGILDCEAVVAGGWAVWFHGYVGRVTQDLDIVLPAARINEFLSAASVSGFEVLPQPQGLWPKVRHKETDINVDILPEGARPGTESKPAPTTIPAPATLGARKGALRYLTLPSLVELKLAAGRVRDEADIVELIRVNPTLVDEIRIHLAKVHAAYVQSFDHLTQRARDQGI